VAGADWTVVAFNDDLSLIYSKVFDSLPVVRTEIEMKPCLDPTITSLSPS